MLLQTAEETDIMGDEKLRSMCLEIPAIGESITNWFRYITGVDSLETPPPTFKEIPEQGNPPRF